MKVFGVDATTGTLSECKAKPENRGKGSCRHADHHKLDEALFTPAVFGQVQ